MLIDLFAPESNCTFNIKLAQVIGLKEAIYCSELIDIVRKATRKNKMLEGDYIKVDRNYLLSRTTLGPEDQRKCDTNLSRIGLISIRYDNTDIISLNISMLISIIANEDMSTIKDIQKELKIKVSTGNSTNKSKKITQLKNDLDISNYELMTKYREWIDSIFASGKTLTMPVIRMFESNLDAFTKGDLDMALDIMDIAIIHSYLDCQWAINGYLANKRAVTKKANSSPLMQRVEEYKKATQEDLGTNEF